MTTDEAVQFRWVDNKFPVEAFPDVSHRAYPGGESGVYLSTSEEATEELPGGRRHIFEPLLDDDGVIYAYDSLCNRKYGPTGLRGEAIEAVPAVELLLSDHLGSAAICPTCRNDSKVNLVYYEEELIKFVDAGGEWPFDDPPSIVFGDEPPVDVSYHLDMSVDVCLPESWWSRFVRQPLADLDVDVDE